MVVNSFDLSRICYLYWRSALVARQYPISTVYAALVQQRQRSRTPRTHARIQTFPATMVTTRVTQTGVAAAIPSTPPINSKTNKQHYIWSERRTEKR